MKLILLAATAFIATPLLAQTTPAPTDPAMQTTPADPAAQSTPVDPAAPADPAMQAPPAPAGDPAMTTQQAPMPMQTPTTGGTQGPGGYQPSTAPTPGAFTPSVPVAQAFPAPAPKASYPVCKKGQFDGCTQRGGK